jgi:hypothetical protein
VRSGGNHSNFQDSVIRQTHHLSTGELTTTPFTHLVQHRFRRYSRIPCHDLQVLLLAHLLVARTELCQYLEIVNVEGGREGIEKFRFNFKRIRECMRSPDRHCNIVSNARVYSLAIWNMEADRALRNKECFVVHFVPVGRGPGRAGWEREFSTANTGVFVCISANMIRWSYRCSRHPNLCEIRLP